MNEMFANQDQAASTTGRSAKRSTKKTAPEIAAGRVAEPGYRLHRLEVFNWGTFDGTVHSLVLDGQTALLVGQNGAGKSTLVDALLTLLVKPGRTRNYNLAAGAGKTERSEKSYVLGAYDRRSQEESNRGDVRYLRSASVGSTTYSVLLACFRNAATGGVFTLAQVLYLSDGSVEKVYCFADDERSIAKHCAGLKGMDRLLTEMKNRGFKATKSYTEYFQWFRRATHVKEQAMDMFNQTVAVKDIQKLNEFIRKHMLESRPWNEKVDDLFRHFKDLSDAHRELERVRQQRDLLEPVERHGLVYRQQAESLHRTEALLAASECYFAQQMLALIEPEVARCETELAEVRAEQTQLRNEITAGQETCRRLRNEMDQAGGERMQQIPLLIRTHESEAATRRANCGRWMQALHEAGCEETASDAAAFDALRMKLPALREQLQQQRDDLEQQRIALIESRVEPVRTLRDAEAELQLLKQRQGNLPPEYVELRRQMCEELKLAERDLPFVAELLAVKPDERDWEASIEMVLRGFALSLLVPQKHYALVSRYVDRTPLRDGRGRGQKLVYLHIAERERQAEGPKPESRSLFRKLDFRDGWSPLLPWVKAELHERFNIRCCGSIDEFQQSSPPAMTSSRHLKLSHTRHEKDDRDRVADPRHFVLGWDNRDKKRRLAEVMETTQRRIAELDATERQLAEAGERLRRRLSALEHAAQFTSFGEIDFADHEREIAELRLELKALEENNDTIRMLKQRLAGHEQQVEALTLRRDQSLKREQALESEIIRGLKVVESQREIIEQSQEDGSFSPHAAFFPAIDELLADDPLTLENVGRRPERFRQEQRRQIALKQDELRPLQDRAVNAMVRFLTANPEEKTDLQASVDDLDDYLRVLERIRAEDLPQFEQRFKERLNEKVAQEVGVLRGHLNTERGEIEDRIDLLNLSLRQVPFGTGSHMRLVARPVRDPEINTFKLELDACVNGQFEGTLEADEARFQRIETLINRLRDEERWRLRVTDVRNWFDFAAVETDDATGEERSYHDDSAGQSGGEKAKLAFTILIAAIAFQYDLDPLQTVSDRFHFVVVDEMFSRIDDSNSAYALELFRRFGLQLLIVAPLDAKARVTEDYVGCYLLATRDDRTSRSQILRMTAREFEDQFPDEPTASAPRKPR